MTEEKLTAVRVIAEFTTYNAGNQVQSRRRGEVFLYESEIPPQLDELLWKKLEESDG